MTIEEKRARRFVELVLGIADRFDSVHLDRDTVTLNDTLKLGFNDAEWVSIRGVAMAREDVMVAINIANNVHREIEDEK